MHRDRRRDDLGLGEMDVELRLDRTLGGLSRTGPVAALLEVAEAAAVDPSRRDEIPQREAPARLRRTP
jgi:hypothetical protein